MVMVPGEILGQFVARELVVRDHAVHDAGLLEHDEVAIDRALRQAFPGVEHLGDRQRSVGSVEDVDELAFCRLSIIVFSLPPSNLSAACFDTAPDCTPSNSETHDRTHSPPGTPAWQRLH